MWRGLNDCKRNSNLWLKTLVCISFWLHTCTEDPGDCAGNLSSGIASYSFLFFLSTLFDQFQTNSSESNYSCKHPPRFIRSGVSNAQATQLRLPPDESSGSTTRCSPSQEENGKRVQQQICIWIIRIGQFRLNFASLESLAWLFKADGPFVLLFWLLLLLLLLRRVGPALFSRNEKGKKWKRNS